MKIIVFDLDETLGYFMELGMFWDALNAYIKDKQINEEINFFESLNKPTGRKFYEVLIDLKNKHLGIK